MYVDGIMHIALEKKVQTIWSLHVHMFSLFKLNIEHAPPNKNKSMSTSDFCNTILKEIQTTLFIYCMFHVA